MPTVCYLLGLPPACVLPFVLWVLPFYHRGAVSCRPHHLTCRWVMRYRSAWAWVLATLPPSTVTITTACSLPLPLDTVRTLPLFVLGHFILPPVRRSLRALSTTTCYLVEFSAFWMGGGYRWRWRFSACHLRLRLPATWKKISQPA